jgi:tetratricopeptide (TPR) repeat protein
VTHGLSRFAPVFERFLYMPGNIKALRCAAFIVSTLSIAGCAVSPAQPPAPTFEHLMFQADERIKAGNLEKARSLLVDAAKLEPTRKEPWLRKAEVEFDGENYGASISASQEALQRAPGDVRAESILTVAGLRVAIESLARLRDEKDVNGPVHTEARKLAARLRETLGTKALIKKNSATKRQPVVAKPVPAPASNNPFLSLPASN